MKQPGRGARYILGKLVAAEKLMQIGQKPCQLLFRFQTVRTQPVLVVLTHIPKTKPPNSAKGGFVVAEVLAKEEEDFHANIITAAFSQ